MAYRLPHNFIVPTPPVGDSSGRAASTQFVANATRTLLTANATYYVPSQFATIQDAMDFIHQEVDGGGFTVTVQVDAGTHTCSTIIEPMVGVHVLYLKGDSATPSNVSLVPSSYFVFEIQRPVSSLVVVEGFELDFSGCTFGALGVYQTGNMVAKNCDWVRSATSVADILAQCTFGNLIFEGSHTIADAGSNSVLWGVGDNGFLTIEPSATVTFSGTLSVAGVFQAYRGGVLNASNGITFVNGSSVSGYMGLLTSGGVIDLNGSIGTTPGLQYISNDGTGIFKTKEGSVIDGKFRVIDRSPVTVTAGATTSEVTIYTTAIGTNFLGPNGALKIVGFIACTNNANSKSVKVKYNGNTYATLDFANQTGGFISAGLVNRSSVTTQIAALQWTPNSTTVYGTLATSAVDTQSASTVVTLTVQKAVAGDTVNLESWFVEICAAYL